MQRGLFLEIKEGEIEEIFKEIEIAEETIKKAYYRLRNLGVVVVRETDSDPSEQA